MDLKGHIFFRAKEENSPIFTIDKATFQFYRLDKNEFIKEKVKKVGKKRLPVFVQLLNNHVEGKSLPIHDSLKLKRTKPKNSDAESTKDVQIFFSQLEDGLFECGFCKDQELELFVTDFQNGSRLAGIEILPLSYIEGLIANSNNKSINECGEDSPEREKNKGQNHLKSNAHFKNVVFKTIFITIGISILGSLFLINVTGGLKEFFLGLSCFILFSFVYRIIFDVIYFDNKDSFTTVFSQDYSPHNLRKSYSVLLRSLLENVEKIYGPIFSIRSFATSFFIAFLYCSFSYSVPWYFGITKDISTFNSVISVSFLENSLKVILVLILFFLTFSLSKKTATFIISKILLFREKQNGTQKKLPFYKVLFKALIITVLTVFYFHIGLVVAPFQLFWLWPGDIFLFISIGSGVFLGLSQAAKPIGVLGFFYPLLGVVFSLAFGILFVRDIFALGTFGILCGWASISTKDRKKYGLTGFLTLLLPILFCFLFSMAYADKTFDYSQSELLRRSVLDEEANSIFFIPALTKYNYKSFFYSFSFFLLLPLVNGFWDNISLLATRKLGSRLLKYLENHKDKSLKTIIYYMVFDAVIASLSIIFLVISFTLLIKFISDVSMIQTGKSIETPYIKNLFNYRPRLFDTWILFTVSTTVIPSIIHFSFCYIHMFCQIFSFKGIFNTNAHQYKSEIVKNFITIILPAITLLFTVAIWWIIVFSSSFHRVLEAIPRWIL